MTEHFVGLVCICTSIKSGRANLVLLAQYINGTTADRSKIKNKSLCKRNSDKFWYVSIRIKKKVCLFGLYICSLLRCTSYASYLDFHLEIDNGGGGKQNSTTNVMPSNSQLFFHVLLIFLVVLSFWFCLFSFCIWWARLYVSLNCLLVIVPSFFCNIYI